LAPKVHTWLSERYPTTGVSPAVWIAGNYQPEISMRLSRLKKQRFQGLFPYVVNSAFPSCEATALRGRRRNFEHGVPQSEQITREPFGDVTSSLASFLKYPVHCRYARVAALQPATFTRH
jgi:hypothetical protein